MEPGPTLILKAGDKLVELEDCPGDFEDWIAAGLGPEAGTVRVLDVRAMPELPDPASVGRVVVTGSAAMVTDRAPWVEATANWLCEAVVAHTPVLGICFGHQLLAHALGGEVGYNPNGVEVGSVALSLEPAAADDPLFSGWPVAEPVNMSHRQAVLALPGDVVPLARTASDPHAAFRHGDRAWGVQFHPEFDAIVTRAHVGWYAGFLEARGDDVGKLQAACVETPRAHALLARFAAIPRPVA
jgi:GMP synthase (glutamine-hydrolysing)